MSVYDKDGNVLSVVYDKDGNALAHAYDKDGIDVFGGDVPVDRDKASYDYYTDPDPDKSYTWSYSLADLKTLQNGNFTIGVQTDTHYTSDNHGNDYGTPLKNLTKQLYCDFICNLGDIPRGYANDTVTITQTAIDTMMSRYTSYVESDFIALLGNHDNATMASGFIPKATMHDNYIGDNSALSNIVNPTEELYFYKDYYECRVIVLDTNNYPYSVESSSDIDVNHHTISAEQVAWFTNVALDTDKPVIVLSHNVLVTDVYPSTMVVPSEDVATNNSIPYRADQIVSAMQTFRNNGGIIVACLSGHIHAQMDAKVNGINYIAFANGGTFAELLFVDFNQRTITTKVINNANISDRAFTF